MENNILVNFTLCYMLKMVYLYTVFEYILKNRQKDEFFMPKTVKIEDFLQNS